MKANQAYKSADDAVSPVIGVILMVAITVVLAAVVFVLVTKLAGNQKDQSPTLSFAKDSDPSTTGGTLTVISIQGAPAGGLLWTDINQLSAAGSCTETDNGPVVGAVDAGEVIVCTGSDGPFRVTYIPTQTLVYTANF